VIILFLGENGNKFRGGAACFGYYDVDVWVVKAFAGRFELFIGQAAAVYIVEGIVACHVVCQ
jgi:hypothetical protein